MRPLSMRLINFHSHVRTYVNFRGRKQCLLVGEIDGRKDVSNGAGKSVFLDAIRFALFGVTRAGTDHTIRDGQDFCRVILVFRGQDGNSYRVHRSLKRNSKGKISSELDFHVRNDNGWDRKEGEVKKAKSAIEAEIRAVVGMDVHVFNQSVYIGQNDIGAFANSPPTERKELLKRIIDLKKWDELETIGKKKLNDRKKSYDTEKRVLDELEARVEDPHLLKIEINKLDGEIARLQTQKVSTELSRQELTDRLKNVEIIESIVQRLAQLTRERTSLIASIQGYSDSTNTIYTSYKNEAQNHLNLFAQEPALKEKLAASEASLLAIENAEKAIALVREEKRALDAEAQALYQTVEELRATLKNFKKQSDEISALENQCPLCLTEIDTHKKHSLKADLKKLFDQTKLILASPTKELETKRLLISAKAEEESTLYLMVQRRGLVNSEIKHSESQLRAIAEGRDYLQKKQVSTTAMLKRYKEEKEKAQAAVNVISAEIQTLDSEIEKAKDDVQNMERLRKEIQAANKLIQDTDRLISEGNGKRAALDARLLMANKLLKELSDKKVEQECSLRKINNLSTVVGMLGKKGIQAIILENSLTDLESYARIYLKKFTDDRFDLTLRTTAESKSTDTVRETLDILIDKGNGVWHPFESFSGGEKMKIAFALRIALAQLVSHYSDVRPEYLYIDEVDGCLDVYSRKVFMDVLAELTKEFDLILLVTHRPGLQEEFRDVITVRRTGDESYLEDTVDPDPEDSEEVEPRSYGALDSFDLSPKSMCMEV